MLPNIRWNLCPTTELYISPICMHSNSLNYSSSKTTYWSAREANNWHCHRSLFGSLHTRYVNWQPLVICCRPITVKVLRLPTVWHAVSWSRNWRQHRSTQNGQMEFLMASWNFKINSNRSSSRHVTHVNVIYGTRASGSVVYSSEQASSISIDTKTKGQSSILVSYCAYSKSTSIRQTTRTTTTDEKIKINISQNKKSGEPYTIIFYSEYLITLRTRRRRCRRYRVISSMCTAHMHYM